ncbi:hypothetical protein ElyMa_002333000 [Elysia marginata]|uniref:Uncharacterized protein n=1 Tax=Elysia marginata TaxID=1093978 RepID=A0AAV4G846_9GAST|nr:hypothetical protein ElyMa_002333000 [Elysia marginata]
MHDWKALIPDILEASQAEMSDELSMGGPLCQSIGDVSLSGRCMWIRHRDYYPQVNNVPRRDDPTTFLLDAKKQQSEFPVVMVAGMDIVTHAWSQLSWSRTRVWLNGRHSLIYRYQRSGTDDSSRFPP